MSHSKCVPTADMPAEPKIHEATLSTGSRMPQSCSQTVTEHANRLSQPQGGKGGSFSEETVRPGGREGGRPSWHGGPRQLRACLQSSVSVAAPGPCQITA